MSFHHISVEMFSSTELSRFMRIIAPLKAKACFRGVFSIDTLPYSFSLPATFIINNQTSNLPGEHWVCVYIDHLQRGEYADSFAMPPPLKVSQWLTKVCNSWTWNKLCVQHMLSTACGAHVIFFAVKRPTCDSMNCVYALLPGRLIDNDKYVTLFIANVLSLSDN